MTEGLRSRTRRTAEKEMIDLNKDPVEDDGSSSKSPLSSAYFSAEEKIDSGLGVDVSSNAGGGGGKEARGAKEDVFKRDEGKSSEGFEGTVGCAFPLSNEGLVKEGLSESRSLEGNRDAATVGVLDLSATSCVEIKGEATGKGRRGRKRKMVESELLNAGAMEGSVKKDESVKVARAEVDGSNQVLEHCQDADMQGNVGCALPLTNVGVIREGLSESRPLGGDRHAATVHVLDLNASGGAEIKDEAAGKGRRGRKRKVVVCELANAVGLERGSLKEEVTVKVERTGEDGSKHEVLEDDQDVNMGGNVACALPLSSVGSIGKGLSESRPFGGDSNAATLDVLELNANGGVEIKGESAGKGRRGRKRKIEGCGLSNAGNLEGGSVEEEESVTVARKDGDKHEILEHGHNVNTGGNVAATPAGNTDEGRQESGKGRRGRKRKALESSGGNRDCRDAGGEIKRLASDGTPQIVGRVLRSRTREANAGKKQACTEEKGLGDRKGEMDLDRSGNRNVKMEIEENTRPAENFKRRRGRPPKIHGRNGSSKVTVNNKANLGSQKNTSLPGRKAVKGHNLVNLRKKKVTSAFLKVHKGKNIDKKEGDMRPKEEKQLLKDQIISILKEAGWTIEYRPRNGRDYLDAVYVDGHGRTHWSVTLAYKKLKQKIEDGTADEKEISAFTPIPGDKLSKLFRITQEGKKSKTGLKVGGNKTENGCSKERPDKKSSGECTTVSKTKANITSGPHQGEKLLKKKIEVVNCEQESSMVVSCTRKPISRRGRSRKPCGLLARESNNELDEGKCTILSWMIDLGIISPGGKVQYVNHERTDVTFEGKITREGICCDCCGKIFTPVDFECHAGSLLGQPLQNICLESGQSLLQCMSESWSKQVEIDHIGFNLVDVENDPDDDTCNICADGGDLICCDGCPSTFHQSCLQIQNFPIGDWHCVYCSCKFCGRVCWGSSQGDDVRDPDDSGFLTCLFCEQKFHVNCMLRKEATSINKEIFPFCGRRCQKLFENLQKLLGVKHELEKGYSWTILRRQDISCNTDLLRVESNSKLAIAFSIIDECFTPITDERSNISLIRSVCYSCGSNLRRLNYSGFCTFILEKDDELVSAATVRVHGNQLAEMPFIGTRAIHRRKGMCRLLLTAIEMALSSLYVEKLVIPAVPELRETWTKVFGFVPLDGSERQEMKHMSLLLFPGADMLQKPLLKYHLSEGETSAGVKFSEPSTEHVNGNTTPADNTSAATAGSALHLTCDHWNHGPGIMNGLANSNTASKDKLCYDFHASEDKLVNFKGGTPERNQVDKVSCVPEGKEALQSQHKTVVYSQYTLSFSLSLILVLISNIMASCCLHMHFTTVHFCCISFLSDTFFGLMKSLLVCIIYINT